MSIQSTENLAEHLAREWPEVQRAVFLQGRGKMPKVAFYPLSPAENSTI